MAATAPRNVVLINGDRLTVMPASRGGRAGAITPAGSALASTLTSLTAGGTAYQVPVDALPYIGRGLDPSLFDVAGLVTQETGGRLPVRLSYQGRQPAMPGVTITRAAAGIADGYLTASSAKTFGAALAAQYLADRAHGTYGTDGMFGDEVSIGPAGTTPARSGTAIQPHYVMHTVTLDGTTIAGKPDTGDIVYLINVDNGRLTGNPMITATTFYHGMAKYSVPAGHYFAFSDFLDLSKGGTLTAERAVVLPEFTVSGDTTVRLDERTATSKVTIATPRPAVTRATELEVNRVSATGRGFGFGLFDFAPVTAWITPPPSTLPSAAWEPSLTRGSPRPPDPAHPMSTTWPFRTPPASFHNSDTPHAPPISPPSTPATHRPCPCPRVSLDTPSIPRRINTTSPPSSRCTLWSRSSR